MPFNVNDPVIVRKLGGHTGEKQVSPDLRGVVLEVSGSDYRVLWSGRSQKYAPTFYPVGVVPEADISAA